MLGARPARGNLTLRIRAPLRHDLRVWRIACLLVACGSTPAADAPAGLCSDRMPAAPTFANVQQLFSGICTTCHTTGVTLDLGPSVAYANLVGRTAPSYTQPPTDESCGGLLVKPGAPDASYLFQKVSNAHPCAGSQMPLNDIGVPSPLQPCAQTLIHDWIAAGAPP